MWGGSANTTNIMNFNLWKAGITFTIHYISKSKYYTVFYTYDNNHQYSQGGNNKGCWQFYGQVAPGQTNANPLLIKKAEGGTEEEEEEEELP